MKVQSIPVIRVSVDHKRRSLSRSAVRDLVQSITEVGLINPITVLAPNATFAAYGQEEHKLIAGLHRLAAFKELGRDAIPAVVMTLNDIDRHLMELDENLMRNDLPAMERGAAFKSRKGWYEAKHPETVSINKRGGPGRGKKTTAENATVSFAADTASKTGASARSVRQAVQIAENIPEDVQDALRETPLADSQKDLLALSKLPEAAQREIAATTDLTDKKAFRAALAARAPAKPSAPEPESEAAPGHRMTIDVTVFGILTAVAYLDRDERQDLVERINEMNEESAS